MSTSTSPPLEVLGLIMLGRSLALADGDTIIEIDRKWRVSIVIGVPPNGGFIRENARWKMDDWG